jgi:hypothetical protein
MRTASEHLDSAGGESTSDSFPAFADEVAVAILEAPSAQAGLRNAHIDDGY